MAHSTAKGLAALGRNGDTMLVHMSPHEVAGLHALALSHGTSLTINPKTGLPEAFSLGGLFKSVLPMVIGAVLTPLTGGIVNPLTAKMLISGATGLGYGLASGDWKKGLSAGIGAFGGAGIGQSLMGMGKAAATNLTAGQAAAINLPETAASEAVKKGAMQKVGQAAIQNQTSGVGMGLMKEGTKQAFTSGAGLKTLGSTLGASGVMGAATPVLSAMSETPTVKPGKETPPMFYNTSFNPGKYNAETRSFEGQGYGPGTWSTQFPGMPATTPATSTTNYSRGNMPGSLANQGQAQQPNPLYGQPGQPQYLPSAGIMGGMQGMAEGGPIAATTYPMANTPAPTYSAPLPYGQMGTGGVAPSGYDPAVDPNSGEQVKMAAGGGIGSFDEYKAGGLLHGPGDGMSDSIPAVIKGPKPQRAALADGEFVIPADVVSHLGNGSTKAGSAHLYQMMDKVRQARTGNHKQGKKINPSQFLSA